MTENEQTPQPDRSEPAEERKAELHAAYQEGQDAPYKGVQIRTLGELNWIFQERHWSGEYHLPKEQSRVNLSGAVLSEANLSGASLFGANLSGANLYNATLSGANLSGATLSGTDLSGATLSGADLSSAKLDKANLHAAQLDKANLYNATLSGGNLRGATLSGANLYNANLSMANLNRANLSRANLSEATLSGADLHWAEFSGAYLRGTTLSGADLSEAMLDKETVLTQIILDHRTRMQGIKLNDADLTEVDWSQLSRFGDDPFWWWNQGNASVLDTLARTYRRLAASLRNQGLSDDADRFANLAQICQRGVYFRRILAWPSRLGQYLFSHLLNLVAGYGYHPERSVFWYLASIVGFALAYMHFGSYQGHPFHMDEAMVFSLTSFHGRGFFPGGLGLDDPITKFAAGEAVVGLFIEISFIATFTQRYFGK